MDRGEPCARGITDEAHCRIQPCFHSAPHVSHFSPSNTMIQECQKCQHNSYLSQLLCRHDFINCCPNFAVAASACSVIVNVNPPLPLLLLLDNTVTSTTTLYCYHYNNNCNYRDACTSGPGFDHSATYQSVDQSTYLFGCCYDNDLHVHRFLYVVIIHVYQFSLSIKLVRLLLRLPPRFASAPAIPSTTTTDSVVSVAILVPPATIAGQLGICAHGPSNHSNATEAWPGCWPRGPSYLQ